MLFNSYIFVLTFLPAALLGYWVAVRISARAATVWLIACSLVFYGSWNASFLVLLLCSICFNYSVGTGLAALPEGQRRRWLFFVGIAANLLLLAFYKYLGPVVNFFEDYGIITDRAHLNIILPLGISFFTFTQIGYLVDRHDGLGKNLGFPRYMLFVTFFPHLVAGPILHIREVGPQITDPATFCIRGEGLASGLTLFTMGLFKKLVLADPLSGPVGAAFSHTAGLALFPAWAAALAYTVQLYFDFSGYSDMAIGLARMFNFRFPVNFDSPYKSRNTIEFWTRWHITLSRYLALLLYNPIAMRITRWRVSRGQKVSHKALAKPGAFLQMVAVPTFYTMLLGGIWHGAGIPFIIWGALNALYLVICHAWRVFVPHARNLSPSKTMIAGQILLTYIAWTVSTVFFRAATTTDALNMLGGMIGLHGIAPSLTANARQPESLSTDITAIATLTELAVSFAIIWCLPNTQQILADYRPILEDIRQPAPKWMRWRPSLGWALAIALTMAVCLIMLGKRNSAFLYYAF